MGEHNQWRHYVLKLGSSARTQFSSKKLISAAKNSTFRLDLTKIKFTMILSRLQTIDWANKRGYENFVSVAL